MEWFLAPYPIGGGQGDPTKAPDITINSWVCTPSEGCSPDTLQAAVEAQAAAGIMMVVGAGNDGIGGCSTVFYPPAIYEASYTVGALVTGTDTIANFSSRGPVTIDGSGRIKPISLLRELALAPPSTPPIRLMEFSAAPPWPLRTFPARWRCCGRPFQA